MDLSISLIDEKHEVRRYRRGESQGTVVAGGNGDGNRLDQLSDPQYVFVDRDHSVYVSESGKSSCNEMDGRCKRRYCCGWWSRKWK